MDRTPEFKLTFDSSAAAYAPCRLCRSYLYLLTTRALDNFSFLALTVNQLYQSLQQQHISPTILS